MHVEAAVFNVAHSCMVSCRGIQFPLFRASFGYNRARASAAQSSSCLLTQSNGANSKFRELPHGRRLYRNFNKSPSPRVTPPATYIRTICVVILALKIVIERKGRDYVSEICEIITPISLCDCGYIFTSKKYLI